MYVGLCVMVMQTTLPLMNQLQILHKHRLSPREKVAKFTLIDFAIQHNQESFS